MHCFKCETVSGDRDSVLRSKKRTYEKIAEATNIEEPFSPDDGDEDKEIKATKKKHNFAEELPTGYEPLWKNINDKDGRRALKYITDRGVTTEQIRVHKIGFCVVGRYAYRIVFPVHYRKSMQGFVCRDFTGSAELKYLNSDGEKGLYCLPSRLQRRDSAILVEGVFDVLAVERVKLKSYDIIGGLGSKLKKQQYHRLNTYNKIVLWAEPDPAGVEGTIKRAKGLMKEGVKVYVVLPDRDVETDTDPGAMHPDEIRERIKGAVKYTSGVAAIMRTRIAFSSKRVLKKGKYGKVDRLLN